MKSLPNYVPSSFPTFPSEWYDMLDNLEFFSDTKPIRFRFLETNISEDKDAFYLDLAVPAKAKEDFSISIDDRRLIISSSEQKSEETTGKEYTRKEFEYSSFTRSFNLPPNASSDNIKAVYEDGVLKLTIKKSNDEPAQNTAIPVE